MSAEFAAAEGSGGKLDRWLFLDVFWSLGSRNLRNLPVWPQAYAHIPSRCLLGRPQSCAVEYDDIPFSLRWSAFYIYPSGLAPRPCATLSLLGDRVFSYHRRYLFCSPCFRDQVIEILLPKSKSPYFESCLSPTPGTFYSSTTFGEAFRRSVLSRRQAALSPRHCRHSIDSGPPRTLCWIGVIHLISCCLRLV